MADRRRVDRAACRCSPRATLLGMLGAANKPGGFSEADVQILSIFAGPAATFLRSRQIFEARSAHAARLEGLPALMGDMAATSAATRLLDAHGVGASQKRARLRRASAFHAPRRTGRSRSRPRRAAEPRSARSRRRCAGRCGARRRAARPRTARRAPSSRCRWRRRARARRAERRAGPARRLRRGGDAACSRRSAGSWRSRCSAPSSEAETEHLARQMATLYDLGLETAALTRPAARSSARRPRRRAG